MNEKRSDTPSSESLRLAREFVADPDKRAQIKVQLCAIGLTKLADLADEAVVMAREIIRLSETPSSEIAHKYVWAVENKTSFILFGAEEAARNYVSGFQASVGGGMTISKLAVFVESTQSAEQELFKDAMIGAMLNPDGSITPARRADGRDDKHGEVEWLHRFLNCTVFGPPPSEIQRAHEVVDALSALSATPFIVAPEAVAAAMRWLPPLEKDGRDGPMLKREFVTIARELLRLAGHEYVSRSPSDG